MLALATLATYLQTCASTVAGDTMRAIVTVESGGYSYAIHDNTTRVTYCVPAARAYPCSRERATAIADSAVGQGHSVDVGIAQVNSGNFRTYRVTASQMLETCANLRTGSAILANAYRIASARFADQREALWHAIMAYNTGSLYGGEDYVRSVVAAALSVDMVPTVPSIKILGPLATTQTRPGAIVRAAGMLDTIPHRITRRPDPRSAPLQAHGLGLEVSRGDLSGSFEPALSKQ